MLKNKKRLYFLLFTLFSLLIIPSINVSASGNMSSGESVCSCCTESANDNSSNMRYSFNNTSNNNINLNCILICLSDNKDNKNILNDVRSGYEKNNNVELSFINGYINYTSLISDYAKSLNNFSPHNLLFITTIRLIC